MTLAEKLHPSKFTAMSSKMAAIVGYIVGQAYTQPALVEMAITSDGFVVGRVEYDCGLNEWVGDVADLRRNWLTLLDAADLTPAEHDEANALFAARITDWRDVPQFGKET